MAISLRIPADKEQKINQLARQRGQSKSALVLEAIDEKLGLKEDRAARIRKTAGWMSEQEAHQLRQATSCFGDIHEGDWP